MVIFADGRLSTHCCLSRSGEADVQLLDLVGLQTSKGNAALWFQCNCRLGLVQRA